MDDKVSKWLLGIWYHQPWARTKVGGMVAATLGRLINWPNSLALLMPLREWDMARTIEQLQGHKRAGNKVFTGAYIINGASGGDKIVTVCKQVQTVHDTALLKLDTNYMRATWEQLMKVQGIGSFIAGQIVADLRHFMPGSWDDRYEWAPVGPGSARGMRRLLGLPHVGAMPQKQFDDLLPALWDELMGFQQASDIFDERHCEAMDLQNCLCEFDKYMRLTNKEGSVRSGYPGQAETGSLL